MDKLAVSATEAARLLSVSKSTVYGLCERGVLPHIRISEKRLVIPVRQLEDWLDKQTEAPKW